MTEALNTSPENNSENPSSTPWDQLKEVPFNPDISQRDESASSKTTESNLNLYKKLQADQASLELVFDATKSWRENDSENLSPEEQEKMTLSAIEEFRKQYPTKYSLAFKKYKMILQDRILKDGTDAQVENMDEMIANLEDIFYPPEKTKTYEQEISLNVPESEVLDAASHLIAYTEKESSKIDLSDSIVMKVQDLRKNFPNLTMNQAFAIQEGSMAMKGKELSEEDKYAVTDLSAAYRSMQVFYIVEQANDKEIGLAKALILQNRSEKEVATLYGNDKKPELQHLELIEPEIINFLEEYNKSQNSDKSSLVEHIEREIKGFTEEEKKDISGKTPKGRRYLALRRIQLEIISYRENYKNLKAAAETARRK